MPIADGVHPRPLAIPNEGTTGGVQARSWDPIGYGGTLPVHMRQDGRWSAAVGVRVK